jgi:regulatory protein
MGETLGFSAPTLKGRALRLLAAREHSRAELEHRLQRFETTPGELTSVLDELQAKGFINEARVVQSVVHRRAERLGTQRVRAELQSKGLPPELVAEAVDGLRATEESRAREVWRRKFGQPASEPRERAKQMRFLAARGFSGEAIRRVVAGADEGD